MLFNPPQEMKVGDKVRVVLRVLPMQEGVDETTVEATLTAGLEGESVPEIEPILVGILMDASLHGDAFSISPLNRDPQLVATDAPTEWAWDITAVKSGLQELDLVVNVRVLVARAGVRGRDLPVITKTVYVRVNPIYTTGVFVGKYWYIILALLISIPPSILALRKLLHREAQPQVTDPDDASQLESATTGWEDGLGEGVMRYLLTSPESATPPKGGGVPRDQPDGLGKPLPPPQTAAADGQGSGCFQSTLLTTGCVRGQSVAWSDNIACLRRPLNSCKPARHRTATQVGPHVYDSGWDDDTCNEV